jgi:CRP/FNR family transcriptional regulator, cyclic AMP receptor protein
MAAEKNDLWYLENIDLPNILCPKKQANIPHSSRMFKKGDYIYLPKDDADKIFFISEGRVKIGAIGENGKEITKVILTKGEVFGELALFSNGQKRHDFAYAMEDTDLCSVTVNEMKSLFRDSNALTNFFLNLMGSRVKIMENRLESLVFKDSRTRIVEFLVEQGKEKGQTVGTETLVKRFLTHQDIANLTATSRQTVTTVLNDLRERNVLTFSRNRLLIRNLAQLEKETSKVN